MLYAALLVKYLKTYSLVQCNGFESDFFLVVRTLFRGDMSDSVINYNYVGNTKVSVSIKQTNANKCTFSEIFLTEILKSFSVF